MGPDNNPTAFDIEFLNTLGARLFDRAEDLATALEFEPVVTDLRLAARVCDKLAGLRYRVAEVAEQALAQGGAATRRDLLDALASAEGSGELPEASRSSHHSS